MFETIMSAFISLFTITAVNPLIRIAKENAILNGADVFAVDQFWLIFNVALTLGIWMFVYLGIALFKVFSNR